MDIALFDPPVGTRVLLSGDRAKCQACAWDGEEALPAVLPHHGPAVSGLLLLSVRLVYLASDGTLTATAQPCRNRIFQDGEPFLTVARGLADGVVAGRFDASPFREGCALPLRYVRYVGFRYHLVEMPILWAVDALWFGDDAYVLPTGSLADGLRPEVAAELQGAFLPGLVRPVAGADRTRTGPWSG